MATVTLVEFMSRKSERFDFVMDEGLRAALAKLSSDTKYSVPFLVRRILSHYLIAQGYMMENELFGNRCYLPPPAPRRKKTPSFSSD